jgi:hypothetical protein
MSDEPLTSKEALRHVGKFQEHLNKAKFDVETNRDKALVLIVGGSLTISFAFVRSLVEHAPIRVGWLEAAWIAWLAALILHLIGFSVSVHAASHVLNALSEGKWDEVLPRMRRGRWIEPFNVAVMVLSIAGFICFGYFALGNTERMATNGESKTESCIQQ